MLASAGYVLRFDVSCCRRKRNYGGTADDVRFGGNTNVGTAAIAAGGIIGRVGRRVQTSVRVSQTAQRAGKKGQRTERYYTAAAETNEPGLEMNVEYPMLRWQSALALRNPE